MSYLLCHECYCWVQPVKRHCPACQHTVDAGIPDPSLDDLAAAIGEIVGILGEVCVQRSMLPDRGLLYATEQGLYFLPHHVDRQTRYLLTRHRQASLLLSLTWLLCAPVTALKPFLTGHHTPRTIAEAFQPQYLSREESFRLPELLMENPGVFFIPRRSIRWTACRRHKWRIDRIGCSSIRLTPIKDRRSFHSRLQDWMESRASSGYEVVTT